MNPFTALRKFFVFLGIFLYLSACAAQNEGFPPELMLGSDICEECGMIVSDAHYAAATLIEGGAHKFDDLAEMFIFQAKHPEDIVRAWFVHDYTTEIWIRGETAFYVMSSEIHSPMGYGVIAFESNAAAERFASELNEPQYYTFDEIRTLIETRP